MEPGAYGIQVPASKQRMKPQVLLIPCLGIDQNRYRLGYGGGYYDRTLARLSPRPVAVGIGFDCARMASIKPQPHDIRLDLAITEGGAL
jgi:5-formyltetrahydrofolate cyclo-ligase